MNPTSPGSSLSSSLPTTTPRAGARDASRTDLARRRDPFSDAGLRIVARPCGECSVRVEWVMTSAMGGQPWQAPAPDTRR